MKHAILACALFGAGLVPAPVAYAQAGAAAPADSAIETVTVTGVKQSPIVTIHNFVSTFSVVSPIAGVITRWREAVCPITVGLTAQFNDTVTARVRQVAGMIGATSKSAPCKPNVLITFTSEPQALLTAAEQRNSYILGTGDARTYAMVHPIQAWYATATVDLRGTVIPDTNNVGMTSGPGKGFGSLPMAGVGGVPTVARAGSIIRDGMGSTFSSVFIVVDLKKVADAPLSAIADYVTMLALAQTEAYDRCEPLASISNLMADNCGSDKKAGVLSPSDIAFLRGVYKTDIGASSLEQRANIVSEMETAVPAD